MKEGEWTETDKMKPTQLPLADQDEMGCHSKRVGGSEYYIR